MLGSSVNNLERKRAGQLRRDMCAVGLHVNGVQNLCAAQVRCTRACKDVFRRVVLYARPNGHTRDALIMILVMIDAPFRSHGGKNVSNAKTATRFSFSRHLYSAEDKNNEMIGIRLCN